MRKCNKINRMMQLPTECDVDNPGSRKRNNLKLSSYYVLFAD